MLLRLTKKTRDYILKSEREGYWERLIGKLQKEIIADEEALKKTVDITEPDEDLQDKIKVKREQLRNLNKTTVKAKTLLAKYGPIVWKIHSADKETIKKEMSKTKISLGKFDDLRQNELTSSRLSYVGVMSYKICKLGIDGWDNMRDLDNIDEQGNHALIPFDASLIGQLPEDIATELANEISGVIDEEELENLS